MPDVSRLLTHSPALHQLLSLLLPEPELQRICAAYDLVSRLMDCQAEPELGRPAGQSFNPRPARLCQILIKEIQEKDQGVLAAAMLSCLSPAELEDLRSSQVDWEPEVTLALAAISHSSAGASRESQAIGLAGLLDEIRHFHLRPLSPEECFDYSSHSRNALLQLRPLPGNEKLFTLVNEALKRFENRNRRRTLTGNDC